MQDIIARAFVIFLLVLYASISLVFIVTAIRKWIWQPIIGKFSAPHTEREYRRIKSTSREESPS